MNSFCKLHGKKCRVLPVNKLIPCLSADQLLADKFITLNFATTKCLYLANRSLLKHPLLTVYFITQKSKAEIRSNETIRRSDKKNNKRKLNFGCKSRCLAVSLLSISCFLFVCLVVFHLHARSLSFLLFANQLSFGRHKHHKGRVKNR